MTGPNSGSRSALHAFAEYLAEGKDVATADLVRELAKDAGFWVKSKVEVGKLMLRLGGRLTKDLEELRRKRVELTTGVASRLIRESRSL